MIYKQKNNGTAVSLSNRLVFTQKHRAVNQLGARWLVQREMRGRGVL